MPNKIEWAAPEYNYYQKDKIWFIAAGAFFGILIVIALWTNNLIFAIFIGLSCFLVIAYGLKKPQTTYISLQPKGVSVNAKLYEFETLSSFWVFYNPPELKEISLKSKRKTVPYIRLPLGGQSPIEARSFLVKYIPEKKQEESLIDAFFRSIGF